LPSRTVEWWKSLRFLEVTTTGSTAERDATKSAIGFGYFVKDGGSNSGCEISRSRRAPRVGARHRSERRRPPVRLARPDVARRGGGACPGAADGTVPLEHFDRLIDERTKHVQITHVSYRNGAKIDVPGVVRLAHERGALALLDCFQSVGAMDIDVGALGVDFAVGAC
jgi:hypothetical protein